MQISQKIVRLRKSKGMSQEELAEKLHVSRQTISRWESESATPDAKNIWQISKLFGVTTDYLLNEEESNDFDQSQITEEQKRQVKSLFTICFMVEVMSALVQFACAFILQNPFWTAIGYLPLIAAVGGFEYVYAKKGYQSVPHMAKMRKTFYKISPWLGLYFPIRWIIETAASFYPRPYSTLILEGLIHVIYVTVAVFVGKGVESKFTLKENK